MNTEEKNKEVIVPKYKFKRSDAELVLKALLPGVKKEDIELNVEDGYLELVALRKNSIASDWSLISSNALADQYKLKLQVHPDYDSDLAKVTFNNNVLNIMIPSRVKRKLELNIQ